MRAGLHHADGGRRGEGAAASASVRGAGWGGAGCGSNWGARRFWPVPLECRVVRQYYGVRPWRMNCEPCTCLPELEADCLPISFSDTGRLLPSSGINTLAESCANEQQADGFQVCCCGEGEVG